MLVVVKVVMVESGQVVEVESHENVVVKQTEDKKK